MPCFRFRFARHALHHGVALLCVGGALFSLAPRSALADEFSTIPSGDALYRHFNRAALGTTAAGTPVASGLTRYEMALKVGRALTAAQHGSSAPSRGEWRALRELISELRPELSRLGVDVDEAERSAERGANESLESSAGSARRSTQAESQNGVSRPAASTLGAPRGVGSASFADAVRRAQRLGTLGISSDLGTDRSSETARERASALELPLSQRLRIDAALLALERAGRDPLQNGIGDLVSSTGDANSGTTVGAGAAVSYTLDSWLSVRALASQRDLNATDSPLNEAPLFAGASSVEGTGGGLDVSLGSLRLSTQVERLRTDAGRAGTRVGGGIGLSAWQNRLSLSAHLSRLLPEDRAALEAQAAELNLGLDVSNSLSLGLQYQNLFTEGAPQSNSRVSGGLSVRF